MGSGREEGVVCGGNNFLIFVRISETYTQLEETDWSTQRSYKTWSPHTAVLDCIKLC